MDQLLLTQNVQGDTGLKKILIVATEETHIVLFDSAWISRMKQYGCEVHAACFMGKWKKRLEDLGVICHHIDFARSPFSLRTLKAAAQLIGFLRQNHFDLVHAHNPVGGILGRFAAFVTGCRPVLYTAHGFHFYHGASLSAWLLFFTAERIAAWWTDGLLVINTEDYEMARQKLGFKPNEKLFYLHGVGVELTAVSGVEKRKQIRQQLNLDDNAVVVICIAEFIARKNQQFLLASWQQNSSRFLKSHLLLVGEGAELTLRREETACNAIPRVQFLGFRDDIPDLLAAADIAVLVSHQEGLPRCVMEAMAAGLPVIGSNIRGNRDLIVHGETGMLVELGDTVGLGQAIEQLTANSELRREMGDAGRRKIADFSQQVVLSELDDVYRRYLPEWGQQSSD